jgi:hypothetical protein
MGLTICKNFKEVPVFWNFFQGSVRQTMIQILATNGKDKDVWRKASDKISNLLHDNTVLTLENTSDAVKYAETYLNREITTSDNHTTVLKTDTSDSKEILGLKVELAELKATQATVTTTQGQGGSRRFNRKRRRDGGARTTDSMIRQMLTRARREEIDTRVVHAGRRVIRKENKGYLSFKRPRVFWRRGSPTTNLPLLRLRPSRLPLLRTKNPISASLLMSHPTLNLRSHVYLQGHITAQDVGNSKWLESLTLFSIRNSCQTRKVRSSILAP